MTFLIANISAYGGNVGGNGSAGTIYLKDRAQVNGDLIIDNGSITSSLNTPLKTDLNKLRNLIVRKQGALDITKEIMIENDLSASTGGRIARQ